MRDLIQFLMRSALSQVEKDIYHTFTFKSAVQGKQFGKKELRDIVR